VSADDLIGTFAVATLVALVATPLARRLALRHHLVDEPGAHKSHRRTVPYLGGLALIVATVAASALSGAVGPTTGRVLLVATVLGAVGLVDDSRPIGVAPRLGCQVLAAALILGAGVRFQLTGSPIADGVISLVWIVGVTNAFNLLDNMDGLSAGVAALAGLAVAGTALAEGRPDLALIAIALVGACVGFLAFNVSPATIFMGDAGSMFLGAMVASLTLAAHPPGTASNRLAVPLLIVALPVVDTATVMLGRARRRLPVMQGGRDHLSHRLVRLGLRSRNAVRTLLVVEAVSAVLAVLVARGAIDAWVGLAAAALPLAGLALWTMRPRVYDDPVVGLPRWVGKGALGAIVLLAALGGAAVWGMLRSRAALDAGTSALQRGVDQEASGHGGAAAADFTAARSQFGAARARLSALPVSLGRVVPVVAVNLRAARVLAQVGWDLSGSSERLAAESQIQALPLRQGTADVAALGRLAPQLSAVSAELKDSAGTIHRLPRTLLVPPVRRDVDRLDAKVTAAAAQTGRLAEAASLVPQLLGAGGPRRYLILVQDSDESRASGGAVGSFGELEADEGRLSAGRFGSMASLDVPAGANRSVAAPADYLERYSRFSPFDLWQNLNMSPDFPTVGALAAELYPQSGGSAVDGVIGIDPAALSDLLDVTGPVRVPGWPTPITAGDVVQVSLQRAYDGIPANRHLPFLGAVTQAAVTALATTPSADALALLRALAPAVDQRHLQLYLTNARDEAFASRSGAAGAFKATSGDQLLVTTQNASANKVDDDLQRSITYDLQLRPVGADLEGPNEAQVRGTIEVVLRNVAPVGGSGANSVGGGGASAAGLGSGMAPGEDRTFLSLYTPLTVVSASIAGEAVPLESGEELGQNVVSSYVDLPPGGSRTITFSVEGSVRLGRGGWYSLDLPHQPVANTDEVSVRLSVIGPWGLRPSPGGGVGRSAVEVLSTDRSRSWAVQMLRQGPARWLAPVPSALPGAPGS
jgi:UDP-GlcNAc:undecaprenyl-phosphate GlcNAc-1-phosphate transferase